MMLQQQKYEWFLFFRHRIVWLLPVLVALFVGVPFFQSAQHLPGTTAQLLTHRASLFIEPALNRPANAAEKVKLNEVAQQEDRVAFARLVNNLQQRHGTSSIDANLYNKLAQKRLPVFFVADTRWPVTNYLARTMQSDFNISWLLLLMGLIVAEYCTYVGQRRHNSLIASMPISQSLTLINRFTVVSTGTFALFMVGIIVGSLPALVHDGFGSLRYLFQANGRGGFGTYVLSDGYVILTFLLYVLAYVLLFTACSLMLSRLTPSLLMNALLPTILVISGRYLSVMPAWLRLTPLTSVNIGLAMVTPMSGSLMLGTILGLIVIIVWTVLVMLFGNKLQLKTN